MQCICSIAMYQAKLTFSCIHLFLSDVRVLNLSLSAPISLKDFHAARIMLRLRQGCFHLLVMYLKSKMFEAKPQYEWHIVDLKYSEKSENFICILNRFLLFGAYLDLRTCLFIGCLAETRNYSVLSLAFIVSLSGSLKRI